MAIGRKMGWCERYVTELSRYGDREENGGGSFSCYGDREENGGGSFSRYGDREENGAL